MHMLWSFFTSLLPPIFPGLYSPTPLCCRHLAKNQHHALSESLQAITNLEEKQQSKYAALEGHPSKQRGLNGNQHSLWNGTDQTRSAAASMPFGCQHATTTQPTSHNQPTPACHDQQRPCHVLSPPHLSQPAAAAAYWATPSHLSNCS